MFPNQRNYDYFFIRFKIRPMIKFYPRDLEIKKGTCKLIFLCVFFFSCILSQGQDLHFTQFDFSPVFLNPANTGQFEGDWRLAGNYRSQWSNLAKGFQTASVSFDKQFYLVGQRIGAGILFVNDESGSKGLYSNKLFASFSYGREIYNTFISLGLQAGLATLTYSNEYSLPSNWDYSTGGFNPTQDSKSAFYPDVNLGMFIRRSFSIFEPIVGASVSHINMPNHSLLDKKEKVPLSTTVHASFRTNFSDEVYLTPKLLMRGNSKSSLTIVGADLGYNFLGNRSSVKRIFCGFYARNGLTSELESFDAQVGTTVGRIDIAVSYDMNVSNLSKSVGKMGAFEISFIYNSLSTVLNGKSIPCERL